MSSSLSPLPGGGDVSEVPASGSEAPEATIRQYGDDSDANYYQGAN
jgi:hypothetical protein